MRATYLVQTAGTTAVVGAFLASDLVAQLLEGHPGSETLWYLQLGLLRPLSALRTSGGAVGAITESNMLIVGLAVLVTAWAACLLQQRVVVGLMANCSLMFVGSLAYQSLLTSGRTASLNALVIDRTPDTALLLVLGVVTTVACLTCHISFINDARGESA